MGHPKVTLSKKNFFWINTIYLGYKDANVTEKTDELYNYKDQINNQWIFDHQGETVEDIVAYMIGESKRVYNECLKYQLNYIEVVDINTQKESIINSLLHNRKEE